MRPPIRRPDAMQKLPHRNMNAMGNILRDSTKMCTVSAAINHPRP
jgi:hypothetical protein